MDLYNFLEWNVMARDFEADPDLDLELDSDDVDDLDVCDEEQFEYEDFAAMGIDPVKPTEARPGSEQKVLMLSARYAAGLPLWHNSDCYDHGPRESELMGANSEALPQPIALQMDADD